MERLLSTEQRLEGARKAWAGDQLGGLWKSFEPRTLAWSLPGPTRLDKSLLGQSGQLGKFWIFLPPSKHPSNTQGKGKGKWRGRKQKQGLLFFVVVQGSPPQVHRRPGRQEQVPAEDLEWASHLPHPLQAVPHPEAVGQLYTLS